MFEFSRQKFTSYEIVCETFTLETIKILQKNIYFCLTWWTKKSPILGEVSMYMIAFIFPSSTIIMSESVSVFLSYKKTIHLETRSQQNKMDMISIKTQQFLFKTSYKPMLSENSGRKKCWNCDFLKYNFEIIFFFYIRPQHVLKM